MVIQINEHVFVKATIHKGHPYPEVKNSFSDSTQLSMKFILLINVKMATIVGTWNLSIYRQQKLHHLSVKQVQNLYFSVFLLDEQLKFYAQFCWAWTFL